MTEWARVDTAKLLAVIATYDDRNFGDESHMLSWTNAGTYGRWELALAIEAVHRHHLNSTELIKPAHVNQHVQAAKNDRAMREQVVRVDDKVAELIESGYRDFRSFRSDTEIAISLIEVPCPFEGCRALKSQPCVIGGMFLNGRNKRHMPHPGRHAALAAAMRAAGYDPMSTAEIECPTCGAPARQRCMNLGRGAFLSEQVNGGIHPLRVARGEKP